MKDILLINPPENYKANFGILNRLADRIAPLNLIDLLSYAQAKGFSADIIDCSVEHNPLGTVLEKMRSENYAYVGFTATTSLATTVYEFSKIIKEHFPKTIHIAGGAHPTYMAEDMLTHSTIDYVVRGEGDLTLVELLEGKAITSIDGLSYKNGATVIHNKERGLIQNLDSLPFPFYEDLKLERYLPNPEYLQRLPVISLMTSRGCPMRCIFCAGSRMFHNTYRMQSYQRMADECERAINKFGARQIRFVDDNFTSQPKRVEDFCREMIKRGLNKKMVWMCPSRVDSFDENLIVLMKEAGCFLIYFGVESGNDEILEKINKRINRQNILRTFKLMKKHNIKTRASFIIGLPGETTETILETIAFAREIDADGASFSIAIPYPGTELFEIAQKENPHLSKEWNSYIQTIGFTDKKLVYCPQGMNEEELKRLQRYAMKTFYLRWEIVKKHLWALRHKEELLRFYFILTKYLLRTQG